ncbi:MAG: hypothetical protein SFT93_05700 [Rickettsiaceae bacterium]|nr:hypothetical protein [Rickettsiaceae bacterium]
MFISKSAGKDFVSNYDLMMDGIASSNSKVFVNIIRKIRYEKLYRRVLQRFDYVSKFTRSYIDYLPGITLKL